MTAKQDRDRRRTGRVVKMGKTPEQQAKFNAEATFARLEQRAGRTVTSKPAIRDTPEDIRRGQTPPENVASAIQSAKSRKSIKSQTAPPTAQKGLIPQEQLQGMLSQDTQLPQEQELTGIEKASAIALKPSELLAQGIKLGADKLGISVPEPLTAEEFAQTPLGKGFAGALAVETAVAVALAGQLLITAGGTGLTTQAMRTSVGQAPNKVWNSATKIRKFPTGEPSILSRTGPTVKTGLDTRQIPQIPTNSVTLERTQVAIGKIVHKWVGKEWRSWLVRNAITYSLGAWLLGNWGKNEGIDGLTFARDKAVTEGNLVLEAEIKKDLDVVLNPPMWEEIGAMIPVSAIPISVKRVNTKVTGNLQWNKLIDAKVERIKSGDLTPTQQGFADIREENRIAQEKLSKDIADRDARIKADLETRDRAQRLRDERFAEQRGETLPPTPEETARLHEELFTKKK